MARVPVETTPTVSPTVSRAGEIQVGAGVQMGENFAPRQSMEMGGALQGAGNQLMVIGNRLTNEFNDARANELFNEYSRRADEIEATYLTTSGKNAIDGYGAVNHQMSSMRDEMGAELDNDVQRQIFRQAAARRMRSVSHSATNHSIVQQRKFAIEEREKRVANHVLAAGRYWDTRNDPQGDFFAYSGAALKETEMLADDLGLPPGSDQRLALIRKTQTGIHTMVTNTLIGENKFVNAMEYLDSAYEIGEMDYSAYQQLKNVADTGFRREQGVSAANRIYNGAVKITGNDFDSAVAFVLSVEGGYTPDDAGKGPSNFGINQNANPDVDVANLTQDQAADIYKRKYWDAMGADSLPDNIRVIAFDTAVNMGVGKAKELLKESGGDPQKMINLRREHYASLVKKDAEKYGKYEAGWEKRLRQLESKITQVGDDTVGKKEPSLKNMMDMVRTMIEDPQARQYAEAELKQKYNEDKFFKEEAYRSNLVEVESTAYQQVGGWKQVPPEKLALLKPQDLAKIVEGAPRGDDPDTVITLMNNPRLWAKGSIEKYRGLLSESTYKQFVASGSKPGAIQEASIDSESFNATLLRSGYKNLIKPTSEKDKESVIRLRDTFQTHIDNEQQVKGRKLSLSEKQVIMDNILMNKVNVQSSLWFDSKKAMFEIPQEELSKAYVKIGNEEIKLASIPSDQRAKIIQALNARSPEDKLLAPMTDELIANMWVRAGKPGVKK